MNYPLQQWIYIKRPQGRVGTQHYKLVESEFSPVLSANEVLVEAKYISVDPYMRIQQAEKNNWEQPHPLNTLQGAATVSEVLESNHSDFVVGDYVLGYTGWQTHAKVHGSDIEKLDPKKHDITTALGVLGMPGRTAWFGLMEVGKPRAGDIVVVSGAAGAVGSLVTQFAIRNGCKVIALAGSKEKCEWLTSLGVYQALNYKDYSDAASLAIQLEKLGGVDVYFDNVGGMITDAVLSVLNLRARVVICGQISQYDGGLDSPELAPRFLHQMLYKRASIQGVLARDYTHRMDEMIKHVGPWVEAGEIEFKTSIVQGFEQLPDALASLFGSNNMGKAMVKI